MARKKSPTLLPDVACLQLVRLEANEQFLLAIVATTSSGALCPLCQCCSESIHSRYSRVVADLPWAGWAVRLELQVRRLFCQNKECPRRIFTERLPGVVAVVLQKLSGGHDGREASLPIPLRRPLQTGWQ
jgi:transposase